jgi:RHS repeat-associated protein
MSGLGIYHYQARFYSPKLGRFLSADTIVAGYANPQALNRYSYVLGNPLKYTDPSGHYASICLDGVQCYDGGSTLPILIGAPSTLNNNNGSNNPSGGGSSGAGNEDDLPLCAPNHQNCEPYYQNNLTAEDVQNVIYALTDYRDDTFQYAIEAEVLVFISALTVALVPGVAPIAVPIGGGSQITAIELGIETWTADTLIDYLEGAHEEADQNGMVTVSIYQDPSGFNGPLPIINYSGADTYFVTTSPGLIFVFSPAGFP